MTWPPAGIEIPTPVAISGSRPMATNSVVPIANPPRASAIKARPRRETVRRGWELALDPSVSRGEEQLNSKHGVGEPCGPLWKCTGEECMADTLEGSAP